MLLSVLQALAFIHLAVATSDVILQTTSSVSISHYQFNVGSL